MANFNPSYVGARPDVAKLVPSRCRTILDVGCATGALGQSLKRSRAGLRVSGIELDREMAAVARRSLDEVFEGDILEVLEQKRLGNTRFDCIILADVLEHLLDPWDALRWLRERHLKPDSVIVASLPNVRHYSTLTSLFFRKRWPYRDRGIHDRTHLRFFAQRNVLDLFEGADLMILSIKRQYRVLEAPFRFNRYARVLAIPPLRDLLTFQYLILATPHRRETPESP